MGHEEDQVELPSEELAAIRRRRAASTKGAWRWIVRPEANVIRLATFAGMVIVDFVRWGAQAAAPRFRAPSDVAVAKGDVAVNHPDAVFIENAPRDIDLLLSEIDRLKGVIESLKKTSRIEANSDEIGPLPAVLNIHEPIRFVYDSANESLKVVRDGVVNGEFTLATVRMINNSSQTMELWRWACRVLNVRLAHFKR